MGLLTKIENAISVIFFVSGVFISVYGVFMRYVFKNPQGWATEFYTMLILWAIFIGFSSALKSNKHIAVDIVYNRVGPTLQKIVDNLVYIIGVIFSSFFIYSGSIMVWKVFHQGMLSTDNEFPLWIYYLAMPIAGILLFVRFIERLYLVNFNSINETEKGDKQ